MLYTEYFEKCRNHYLKCEKLNDLPSTESFYRQPVFRVPTELFSKNYLKSIRNISKSIYQDFDILQKKSTEIMVKHDNFWKYKDDITNICNELVPFLEKKKFGCYLYVDKIYIYRTLKVNKKQSSYLWHYDNNPDTIMKNIIYLNDVNEKNSPFEYVIDKKNKEGVMVKPSRRGTEYWKKPPNGSRLETEVSDMLATNNFDTVKVFGDTGTTYCFNNDAIHRVNPIIEGYRDVINIRVRPTYNKISYIDKKYTTGFEVSGAVNRNPEII